MGAGLSKNAKFPSGKSMPLWDDLGKRIAADIPGHGYVGAIDAISAFEHEFGRRELIKRLHRELLVDEARPGAAHRAFARLRFDRVVTTNFEFLLEGAYAEVGERCDVVLDEEQLPIPTAKNGTVLLKLHGDLRHPARLVATEDDYDGFLGRYPVLATHVASLLIDRIPVLIGYSLDDPDLRQLLATLRDRLGPMLPNAYVIAVAPDGAMVSRYARRGIKVVALPGTVDRYDEILETAFTELDDHWRARALEAAHFSEERPLEQVEMAVHRKASRLVYFSVPLSLLAFYRDEVFAVAEQAGWVPVSGFDIEVGAGNQLAAIRALLETSQLAVIDMTEGAGTTELGAAIAALGPDRVLMVTSPHSPNVVHTVAANVIHRAPSLADARDGFLERMAGWFQQHRLVHPTHDAEARNLLGQKQWRAALIAAVADLELMLRLHVGGESAKPRPDATGRGRPASLGRLVAAAPQIEPQLRDRLMTWVALRNSALHERRQISPKEARDAVSDVEEVRRRYG